MDRGPIKTLDDYADALDRGEVVPSRVITCPECGGKAHVTAQPVGDTLRTWIECTGYGGIVHGDRGPQFPGWETLAD